MLFFKHLHFIGELTDTQKASHFVNILILSISYYFISGTKMSDKYILREARFIFNGFRLFD